MLVHRTSSGGGVLEEVIDADEVDEDGDEDEEDNVSPSPHQDAR